VGGFALARQLHGFFASTSWGMCLYGHKVRNSGKQLGSHRSKSFSQTKGGSQQLPPQRQTSPITGFGNDAMSGD